MASSSLRLAQPTFANTFFTKPAFPSAPFTNRTVGNNAHPITKVTCVNGLAEILPCNRIIGDMKTESTPLKIGIIGFGNFGQFIAEGIKRQGHYVLVTSRTDYSEYCKHNEMRFFRYCILCDLVHL
jgi:NADP oxidoreductase coenzyme F420-dependent